MNTNIQNIADKLAGAWARHRSWMEVAKAAVECGCKKEAELPEYRLLKQGEILQAGDEFSFRKAPWFPVTEWIGCELANSDYEIRRRVDTVEDKLAAATAQVLDFSECVNKQSARIKELENALGLAQNTNHFDAFTHLKEVNADQRVQLENALSDKVRAKAKCHELFKEVGVGATYAAELSAKLSKLEAHNKELQAEMQYANNVWAEIYSWIQTNVRGNVGKRCCDVALELLKNNAAVVADKDAVIGRLKEKLEDAEPLMATHGCIDWKERHDSLKRQADQATQERDEKLEKAARYINGLESDLLPWRVISKTGETLR